MWGQESGHTLPARPPLARVCLTLLAGPRSASLRLGLPSGAARAWGPGKEEVVVGRCRSGSGRWAGRLGSGRAGRRAGTRGLAGPVSAAPCPQRGRRERRARGCGASASPPSRPRRLWPGLRWALGAGPAAGRRPRAAARGPTDGKGRGSCQRVSGPLWWRNLLFLPRLAGALLSLSLYLTLSLPGWKFPLTSREDRQTDTGAHAAGAGGGVAAGGGGSPRSWGTVRPPPGLAGGLRASPSGPLRGAREGRACKAGAPECPWGSPSPVGTPEVPKAAADRDAPGKRLWPSRPGKEQRRGGGPCGCPRGGPEPLKTGPSIWRA